jgi:hypothetical protein
MSQNASVWQFRLVVKTTPCGLYHSLNSCPTSLNSTVALRTQVRRAALCKSLNLPTLQNSIRFSVSQYIAQELSVPELLPLIRNFDGRHRSDFDFGLLSAEFQLQACRDKTFAKTYANLHRTRRDTLAGLITKLFAKLGRTPPASPKDLAEIIMGLTGLSLQRTSVEGPSRKRSRTFVDV